jgi:hypothetical protein
MCQISFPHGPPLNDCTFIQAKQLLEVTVGWLERLQEEVTCKALDSGLSEVPLALCPWTHGRSAYTGVKPMVQPTDPEALLEDIFKAFPTLEKKLVVQAGLDEKEFQCTEETGHHKALKRLHKRNIPSSLHADLQDKFSSWIVRNYQCSTLNLSLLVCLMLFLVTGSCHVAVVMYCAYRNRATSMYDSSNVSFWSTPLKLVSVQNIHAKRDEVTATMERCPTESHTGILTEVHPNCDAGVTLPASSEYPENEVSYVLYYDPEQWPMC